MGNALKIRIVATGQEFLTLPGYLSEVIGVAFSPLDGVASAGTCIPLANRGPVGPGPNPRDTLTYNG